MAGQDEERRARLAQALRDNLRRRKAHGRGLAEEADGDRDSDGDGDQRT